MMRTSYLLGFLLLHAIDAVPLNFPYETTQLTAQEIGNFSAISFGNLTSARSTSTYQGPRCKVRPEDAAWPSEAEWARLNATVDGHLLKPSPVGAACYPDRPEYNNATCSYLLGPATSSRFFFNDPLTALTTWGEGATCLQLYNTTGRTCTQGGFPVYVVNATSVRDIQAAVNFARNQNLRLVIK